MGKQFTQLLSQNLSNEQANYQNQTTKPQQQQQQQMAYPLILIHLNSKMQSVKQAMAQLRTPN